MEMIMVYKALRKKLATSGTPVGLYQWTHGVPPSWAAGVATPGDERWLPRPTATVAAACAEYATWYDTSVDYFTLYHGITTVAHLVESLNGADVHDNPRMFEVRALVTIWPGGAIDWHTELPPRERRAIERLYREVVAAHDAFFQEQEP